MPSYGDYKNTEYSELFQIVIEYWSMNFLPCGFNYLLSYPSDKLLNVYNTLISLKHP